MITQLLVILIATQLNPANGVINGVLSNPLAYPFYVFLQDLDQQNCGGSIIDNR